MGTTASRPTKSELATGLPKRADETPGDQACNRHRSKCSGNIRRKVAKPTLEEAS